MRNSFLIVPPLGPGLRLGLGIFLGFSLFLFSVCTIAYPAPPYKAPPALGSEAYLGELIAEAGRRQLWEGRGWQVLLHYRRNNFGGVESEADGPGFYLSPRGKTDPRAELEATLAGFFSDAILEPGQQTAQCTFVARREWLAERLRIDWTRLPRDPCERFAEWQRRLDPGSVTLIYASYYFNNPSSMFGHTLLRLDKRGRAEDQRLLDYTVAYGAVVPPDTGGLLWAIKGVFGAYEGYFSLLPYYAKVREYNDFEDRDLWEYRLALSDEEVARLLRHAWEMGSTYYDYYFFRENCSYQLLALIEAARPELRLRERFPLYTLPTSTLRAVLEQPGLVESVTFRASRGTQIHWKLDELSAPARDLVFDLAADSRRVEAPAFAALEVEEKALVLEAAADIHQRELAGDGQNDPRRQELRRLLLARAKLGTRRAEDRQRPTSRPPEEGHGSSRLFLGAGGGSAERTFTEAGFDLAFHELLAREDGYAPNSQILGVSLRLRYEPEPERVAVERADLVNIVSLFPMSRLSRQFSWHVRAGWERSRDLGCAACVPFVLDGGIGAAAESHVLTRETFFAFLEPALQVDGLLPDGYRFGLGGTAGLLFEFTPNWRVALTGSRTRYLLGVDEPVTVERAALRQRYSLSRNFDLRLDWSGVEDYREVLAGVSLYF